LLDREPKESILGRFDVTAISHFLVLVFSEGRKINHSEGAGMLLDGTRSSISRGKSGSRNRAEVIFTVLR
jgi:hypothetical protein